MVLQRVFLNEESKLGFFGRRVGERWKNDCLQPSVKHGGGTVLVWGCISVSGVGDIVQIDVQTIHQYSTVQDRQVLINHAIPSGKFLIGNGFIFEHDNDPKSNLERKTADKTLTFMV